MGYATPINVLREWCQRGVYRIGQKGEEPLTLKHEIHGDATRVKGRDLEEFIKSLQCAVCGDSPAPFTERIGYLCEDCCTNIKEEDHE